MSLFAPFAPLSIFTGAQFWAPCPLPRPLCLLSRQRSTDLLPVSLRVGGGSALHPVAVLQCGAATLGLPTPRELPTRWLTSQHHLLGFCGDHLQPTHLLGAPQHGAPSAGRTTFFARVLQASSCGPCTHSYVWCLRRDCA